MFSMWFSGRVVQVKKDSMIHFDHGNLGWIHDLKKITGLLSFILNIFMRKSYV